jgi:hypothetical protein
MHDLIPLDPALPALGTLTMAEIDATMAYAEAKKALATRAAYASDWRSPPGAPLRHSPAGACGHRHRLGGDTGRAARADPQ